MPETERPFISPDTSEPEDIPGYRPISGLAVGGVVLGLLSPLAFQSPFLWCLPLAGIIVNALALRRIAEHEPELIGKNLARVGLVFSILCLVAPPTRAGVFGWQLKREGQAFIQQWFDYLRDRQPHKAHQLTVDTRDRRPFDDKLWDVYRKEEYLHVELERYVHHDVVRDLLQLGDQAVIRYVEARDVVASKQSEGISLVYAVTYGEGKAKTSFFIMQKLLRTRSVKTDAVEWKLTSTEFMRMPPSSYTGMY